MNMVLFMWICFNTQPPEGGWPTQSSRYCAKMVVSTHSRPKAAGISHNGKEELENVSTHSRPKAAGFFGVLINDCLCGFNTQPPEGGWTG